jgi:hypothetical protein
VINLFGRWSWRDSNGVVGARRILLSSRLAVAQNDEEGAVRLGKFVRILDDVALNSSMRVTAGKLYTVLY